MPEEDGGHCQCFSCPTCPHPVTLYCNACEGLEDFPKMEENPDA